MVDGGGQGGSVVVVELVGDPDIREVVRQILDDVEGVHEVEGHVFSWLEDFGSQDVPILAVVELCLAVASGNQPFVIGLERGHREREHRTVRHQQRVDAHTEWAPLINEHQTHEPHPSRAVTLLPAREEL